MISDEYKELNRTLHNAKMFDGPDALRYFDQIKEFAERMEAEDAIDYGCGCALLSRYLPFPVQNYDPCIPQYSASPKPADLVVSLDVLEHIEPEYLDETLDYIASLAPAAFLVIALLPDKSKLLPDGSNPHRSLHSPKEWTSKLQKRYKRIRSLPAKRDGKEVVLTCW